MADSLLTGVTGLQAHQNMLSVVGNNLANVNTIGFKTQTAQFQDILYQTLGRASVDGSGRSGTDPIQIGLGVSTASISTNFSGGSLQVTGRDLDLGLQGNGFFVINKGAGDLYTRAGAFDISADGFLVDPSTGARVQRFGTVGETGPIPFQNPASKDISIPFGAGTPAQATANVTLQGNLSASLAIGEKFSTAIQVFDSQGTAHSMTIDFSRTAVNPDTYSVSLSVSGGLVNGFATPTVVGSVRFNANGSLQSPASIGGINLSFPAALPANQPISLSLGTIGSFDGLTQFGNTSSAAAVSQDGFEAGALTSISIGLDGTVRGNFTNGRNLLIAQIAVASFANPGGLERQGNNSFSVTPSSGPPIIGAANSSGRGSIQQRTLEQSNVDVGLEFTRLIVAQRGFQVNARAISISDQTLQALVNIQ